MWPFTKKNKIPANDLAKVLYNKFVLNTESDVSVLKKLNINNIQRTAFQTRTLSCRFAVVLMALVAMEEKNDNFVKVREYFEKIISDRTVDIEQQYRKITVETLGEKIVINFRIDIKQSLVALKELLHSDSNKHFTWATKWYKDLNIEVVNPVDLTMLCMVFMDGYVLIYKTLENSDPV
jgi:hypothetical protein